MTRIDWCETHDREWDTHYGGCEMGYQRVREGGRKVCDRLTISIARIARETEQ